MYTIQNKKQMGLYLSSYWTSTWLPLEIETRVNQILLWMPSSGIVLAWHWTASSGMSDVHPHHVLMFFVVANKDDRKWKIISIDHCCIVPVLCIKRLMSLFFYTHVSFESSFFWSKFLDYYHTLLLQPRLLRLPHWLQAVVFSNFKHRTSFFLSHSSLNHLL